MSSHHIIRENQEPALVLLKSTNEEFLGQLCEWSPKIYCHYLLLDWIKDIQIKVDVIFGPSEFRSTSLESMKDQIPIDYLELDKSDDLRILTKSIDNRSIHLLGDNPAILNQSVSNKEIILYNEMFKAFHIKGKWQKWKNEGEKFNLSSSPDKTSNLILLESEYSVIESGLITIYSENGLIIQELS